MNSENSKTPKPHILKLKLASKLDLRIGEKVIALPNLSIYYMWKKIKSSYNNKFKYLHRHGMMNLNCLLDYILYEIFKIISKTFLKNMGKILISHQYNYM